jgi:hypothetical protein
MGVDNVKALFMIMGIAIHNKEGFMLTGDELDSSIAL